MWERIVALNLIGVFACTHAVLPGMQEAGYGRIVNIASEAAGSARRARPSTRRPRAG